MKKFTKIIALLVCLAMVACVFAACKKSGGTNEGDTTAANTDETTEAAPANTDYDFSKSGDYTAANTKFVIGATGPLTGGASSYGISVQQGATLAAEEINAAGGINGIEVDFQMMDDEADATKAGNGYDSLYEKGMQVSLGSVTSGSCEQFATRTAEDGVFALTPSASAASVIAASDYMFRICFGDPDQGVLAAEDLSENYQNIGAIYDNSDPYSSGIYEAFQAKMKELNTEYVEQTFDAENKRDFSTQVDALKDCDVIFMPIYYTEAGLIAKACVAKGVDAVLYGCDGFDGIAGQLDDSVTNKIMYITPFDATAEDEKTQEFVKAYEAKYGTTPDQFAADAYDAMYVIASAMTKLGVDNVTVGPEALGDAMVATITAADFSYTGVTGEMTWDATGACTKVPVIVEFN